MNDLEKSIDKGISFIKLKQRKDGTFSSATSSNIKTFDHKEEIVSPFFASLILSCLRLDNTKQAKIIKDKIVKMLLKQKSEAWTFNYWKRNSIESKKSPYPDDLDDTFCAMAGIFLYDKSLVSNEAISCLVDVLTALEAEEGGPYRTWLVGDNAPDAWKDIDIAVNSNVAYFLNLQEIRLKKLNKLIEDAIESEDYSSPYYANKYSVIYFISRFYRGSKKKKVVDFLCNIRNKRNFWNNPLDTALAISSLIELGCEARTLEKSISYLIKNQDKGWNAYPFVIESKKNKKIFFAGSSALTTAFCVEAIAKYKNALSRKGERGMRKNFKDNKSHLLDNEIMYVTKKYFSIFDSETRSLAIRYMQKMLKKNKDGQIVLIGSMFKNSLIGNEEFSDKHLVKLAVANVLGWMAYSIFDDFIDEEGNGKMLPIAIFCAREVSAIYAQFFSENKNIFACYRQIMDSLDKSNAWELQHCRIFMEKGKFKKNVQLPDFGDFTVLADRSMGHALGPVAILMSMGHSFSSKEVQCTLSFFKHYIIARQINDDMHDWEEDLKKGHITSVVNILLRKVQRHPSFPEYIDVSDDISKLKEILWGKSIEDVCKLISSQTKSARKSLHGMRSFCDVNIFENMLISLELAVSQTLSERKDMIEFLYSYEKKNQSNKK